MVRSGWQQYVSWKCYQGIAPGNFCYLMVFHLRWNQLQKCFRLCFYLPCLLQWLENGQWIFVKTLEDYCDRWVECLVFLFDHFVAFLVLLRWAPVKESLGELFAVALPEQRAPATLGGDAVTLEIWAWLPLPFLMGATLEYLHPLIRFVLLGLKYCSGQNRYSSPYAVSNRTVWGLVHYENRSHHVTWLIYKATLELPWGRCEDMGTYLIYNLFLNTTSKPEEDSRLPRFLSRHLFSFRGWTFLCFSC